MEVRLRFVQFSCGGVCAATAWASSQRMSGKCVGGVACEASTSLLLEGMLNLAVECVAATQEGIGDFPRRSACPGGVHGSMVRLCREWVV